MLVQEKGLWVRGYGLEVMGCRSFTDYYIKSRLRKQKTTIIGNNSEKTTSMCEIMCNFAVDI